MSTYFRRTVVVANAAVAQTTLLYAAQKGLRVRGASLQRLTPAAGGSTATWSLGDATLATRYINAVTCAGAVGDLVDGALATYLYLALDAVQLVYTPGAGPGATAAVCAVLLEVDQVWPKYV